MAIPTQDDYEELILSCRYGDLEDVESFISQFGVEHLATARDDNGNTILHMAAANGHTDLLETITPRIPASSLPALLRAQNKSGSTALHWAALNAHLSTCQYIVSIDAGPGTGVELLDIRNVPNGDEADKGKDGGNGRSVVGVAEEAGWKEGASWMVSVMRLDEEGGGTGTGGAREGETEENFDGGDVEIEIEDADGGIAKMSLGKDGQEKPVEIVSSKTNAPVERQGSAS